MFQQKFVLFDVTLISLVLWYSVPSLKKNDHGQNFLHTSDLCLTLRLVCRNSRFPVSSEVKCYFLIIHGCWNSREFDFVW